MKFKPVGLSVLLLLVGECLWAAQPKVFLVFPLENMSGNPSVGWMSEGIAELIATRLASPTRYVLQREDRDDTCEQLGLPREVPLTLASEFRVAQALGATVAIIGHFTLAGDQLTTSAQWLDVPKLSLSRPVVVTGKLNELDVLETRLAWQLLKAHGKDGVEGNETEFSNRFPPVRLDAFESYIRGVLSTDSTSRVHFLEEANRLNPDDHRAAFALGRYYFDQEDYTTSARWLRSLNPVDRDYPEALFLLGIDEYYLNQDGTAEIDLKKLRGIAPLGEALNNLGVVELRLGHYDEAQADFKQALLKDQDDSDYAFNMGLALWHLKKYDQVAELARKAIAQDSDDLDAHVLLAEASGELGDSVTRQNELNWISNHEKADADDPPRNGGNNQNIGNVVPSLPDLTPRIKKDYDAKDFHLASLTLARDIQRKLAEQPAQEVRTEGETHLKQGVTLVAAGRLPEAERELTQAALLLPESSEAHQALGQVYEREGKHTFAAVEFETSLKEKDSYQAHLWLARAYVSLKHLMPALKQAQLALALEPSSIEAKNLVQQIQAQLSALRDKP